MATNKNNPATVQEAAETAVEAVKETSAAVAETVAVPKDPYAEKEMLYIPPPMSKGEEKDVIVYINGRNWIMPKGGTYEVPKCVAAEYRRSLAARGHSLKRKADMVQKEQKINAHADDVINGKA